MVEPPLEFRVGAAKRLLGIDLGVTRKIGDDEQQIADLLFKRRRSVDARTREFRGDFLGFLANLAKNLLRVVPIEADRGRLLLQLEGARQRGQGERHAVKQTGRRRALLAPPSRAL